MENLALSEPTATLEALDALKGRQAQAAECASLDQELTELRSESSAIEVSNRGVIVRLESAKRVLRFEDDRSIALGKNTTPEHGKLTAVVEQLDVEAVKLAERKREISARVEQLESEKRRIVLQSAQEFRDAAITLIRAAETSLASILDETRNSLNTLEMQLGASIYKPDELTSPERSEAWRTLHSLYSGRVR